MSTDRNSDPGVSLDSSVTWETNTDSEKTLGEVIDREWQEGSADGDERPGDVIDREWLGLGGPDDTSDRVSSHDRPGAVTVDDIPEQRGRRQRQSEGFR